MYTIELSSGQATQVLLGILQGEKHELIYAQKNNSLREGVDAEKLVSAINTLLEHYGSWR